MNSSFDLAIDDCIQVIGHPTQGIALTMGIKIINGTALIFLRSDAAQLFRKTLRNSRYNESLKVGRIDPIPYKMTKPKAS